jgi:hypothetical protein
MRVTLRSPCPRRQAIDSRGDYNPTESAGFCWKKCIGECPGCPNLFIGLNIETSAIVIRSPSLPPLCDIRISRAPLSQFDRIRGLSFLFQAMFTPVNKGRQHHPAALSWELSLDWRLYVDQPPQSQKLCQKWFTVRRRRGPG